MPRNVTPCWTPCPPLALLHKRCWLLVGTQGQEEGSPCTIFVLWNIICGCSPHFLIIIVLFSTLDLYFLDISVHVANSDDYSVLRGNWNGNCTGGKIRETEVHQKEGRSGTATCWRWTGFSCTALIRAKFSWTDTMCTLCCEKHWKTARKHSQNYFRALECCKIPKVWFLLGIVVLKWEFSPATWKKKSNMSAKDHMYM